MAAAWPAMARSGRAVQRQAPRSRRRVGRGGGAAASAAARPGKARAPCGPRRRSRPPHPRSVPRTPRDRRPRSPRAGRSRQGARPDARSSIQAREWAAPTGPGSRPATSLSRCSPSAIRSAYASGRAVTVLPLARGLRHTSHPPTIRSLPAPVHLPGCGTADRRSRPAQVANAGSTGTGSAFERSGAPCWLWVPDITRNACTAFAAGAGSRGHTAAETSHRSPGP